MDHTVASIGTAEQCHIRSTACSELMSSWRRLAAHSNRHDMVIFGTSHCWHCCSVLYSTMIRLKSVASYWRVRPHGRTSGRSVSMTAWPAQWISLLTFVQRYPCDVCWQMLAVCFVCYVILRVDWKINWDIADYDGTGQGTVHDLRASYLLHNWSVHSVCFSISARALLGWSTDAYHN